MVAIRLGRGEKFTVVDDVDADLASGRWVATTISKNNHQSYAKATPTSDSGRKSVFIHRVIMSRVLGRDLVKGEIVDHINNDCLDNRRANLRLADTCGNARNAQISKRNTSGAKGVSWRKETNKWRARIRVNYELLHLGDFERFEDAVEAYNKAAEVHFKDYAWLNPTEGQTKEAPIRRQPTTKLRANNLTGYHGVYRYRSNRYCTGFQQGATKVRVNGFTSAEEAAREYDRLAIQLKGLAPDSPYLNFPDRTFTPTFQHQEQECE